MAGLNVRPCQKQKNTHLAVASTWAPLLNNDKAYPIHQSRERNKSPATEKSNFNLSANNNSSTTVLGVIHSGLHASLIATQPDR